MPIGRAAGDAGAVVGRAFCALGQRQRLDRGTLGVSFRRAASSLRVRRAAHHERRRDRRLPPTIAHRVCDRARRLGHVGSRGRARADDQQNQACPDGRAAPGHHVRAVVENERTIGYVWFGPEADASDDRWWLWDIWVNGSDRGRGVGGEVLALVEAEVRRLHGTSLGLSVLGSNDRARRLYERSGYAVVTARMRKLL